jgi:hypothetical protein
VAVRDPDIRVYIRSRFGEESGGSQAERKKAFWLSIYEAKRRSEDELVYRAGADAAAPRSTDPDFDPDRMEERFRRAFPRTLEDHLRSFLQSPVRLRGPQFQPELPVVFELTQLSYGSLDLGLVFEPVGKVVEAFDKNFEYFRMAFEAFVPHAISSAFWSAADGAILYSDPWDSLRVDVEISPQVARAFTEVPAAPVPPQRGTSGADKARWAWIVANTSLLVPTALAGIYLYLAHQDMRDGEHERGLAAATLQDQQTRLLSTCGTALAQAIHPPSPPPSNPKPAG